MRIFTAAFGKGNLKVDKGIEKGPALILEQEKYSIIPVSKNNIKETHKNIFSTLQKEDSFMLIGGDHSVTYPAVKAFAQKDTGFIVFDAHPDCMHNFKPVTHENYLRALIEDDIIKKENVIIIGARVIDNEERVFIKENSIKTFSIKEIQKVISLAKSWKKIYVSVDIDVIDPEFAPGTGYPEQGGCTPDELYAAVDALKALPIKAVDIVEVNPDLDRNNKTVSIARKLVYELTKAL